MKIHLLWKKYKIISKITWHLFFINKFFGPFISWKVVFRKSLFKLSCVSLPLEKLINRKYFLVKEKFDLISIKVFLFYFVEKTLFRSCKQFKNVLLFVNYIKFDSQSFDYYIFCFEFFFSISSLRIWFLYQFWHLFF
jgi:hypothetical protein